MVLETSFSFPGIGVAEMITVSSGTMVTLRQEIRQIPGTSDYDNFGSTIRKGFELQAIWTPVDNVELRWTYGRAQSRVKQNGNASLVGNQVTAVPTYTSTLQARWSVTPQWAVHGVMRHVGKMAVNAENSLWSQAYNVADVGVQYKLPASVGLTDAALSLQVRNVTDKGYASNTSVIGGTHLVAPGAPRTFMLGLNFSL